MNSPPCLRRARPVRPLARMRQRSQGQGLQQTSETLATTTKQIEDIYQGASAACATAIENCRAACADDEGFAHACQQESGKYHAQLNPGQAEAKRGTAGANDASEQAHADRQD